MASDKDALRERLSKVLMSPWPKTDEVFVTPAATGPRDPVHQAAFSAFDDEDRASVDWDLKQAERRVDEDRPGYGDALSEGRYLCGRCKDVGMLPMDVSLCEYLCSQCPECEVCNTPVRQSMGLHLVDVLCHNRFCSVMCLATYLGHCRNDAHRFAHVCGIMHEFVYRYRDADMTLDQELRIRNVYSLVMLYGKHIYPVIASHDCSDGPGAVRPS